MQEYATVDSEEIDRFAAQAEDWWDPRGSFRMLHRLNPVRLDFICQYLLGHFGRDASALRPFRGLSLLDIGCGGGLATEPMARLGFAVTGIDAGAEAIAAAQTHADAVGLAVDYRIAAAEAVAEAGERFDAVLALEVIEHVADAEAFFAAVGALVRPGGAFVSAELAEAGLPTNSPMQIALTLKPDERANPHGVPGHSHVVRDSLEPKNATGFGQHGGLGDNEQRPFLFISGGAFQPGTHHRRTSLIDIAPTVLRHLGLEAAGMDGRPLPRHP